MPNGKAQMTNKIPNPNDKSGSRSQSVVRIHNSPSPSDPSTSLRTCLKRGKSWEIATPRQVGTRNDKGGQGRGDCRAPACQALVGRSLAMTIRSREKRLPRPSTEGLAMTIRSRGGRTSPGHSERVSTMGKPTGDDLRHRTATFWFSILRVSTAIARARMTFPGAAS
jgi:hypothetical protein